MAHRGEPGDRHLAVKNATSHTGTPEDLKDGEPNKADEKGGPANPAKKDRGDGKDLGRDQIWIVVG